MAFRMMKIASPAAAVLTLVVADPDRDKALVRGSVGADHCETGRHSTDWSAPDCYFLLISDISLVPAADSRRQDCADSTDPPSERLKP